ncbi:MAG: hypothetical protein ACKVUS_06390, partial [Saprospiraceae bacterium]
KNVTFVALLGKRPFVVGNFNRIHLGYHLGGHHSKISCFLGFSNISDVLLSKAASLFFGRKGKHRCPNPVGKSK